jgi:hypothetical protein
MPNGLAPCPGALGRSDGRERPRGDPRLVPACGSVMACWQRNWQLTQPPAAARRRRTDMKITKASAAATTAPAAATVTAITRAALSK